MPATAALSIEHGGSRMKEGLTGNMKDYEKASERMGCIPEAERRNTKTVFGEMCCLFIPARRKRRMVECRNAREAD